MRLRKNIAVIQPNPGDTLTNANKERIFFLAEQMLDDILSHKVSTSEYWFISDEINSDESDFFLDVAKVYDFLVEILFGFVYEYLVDQKLYASSYAETLILNALWEIRVEQEIIESYNDNNLVNKFNCILSTIYARSEVRIFAGRENFARLANLFQDNWKYFNASKFFTPEKLEFIGSPRYFPVEWRSQVEKSYAHFREMVFKSGITF